MFFLRVKSIISRALSVIFLPIPLLSTMIHFPFTFIDRIADDCK